MRRAVEGVGDVVPNAQRRGRQRDQRVSPKLPHCQFAAAHPQLDAAPRGIPKSDDVLVDRRHQFDPGRDGLRSVCRRQRLGADLDVRVRGAEAERAGVAERDLRHIAGPLGAAVQRPVTRRARGVANDRALRLVEVPVADEVRVVGATDAGHDLDPVKVGDGVDAVAQEGDAVIGALHEALEGDIDAAHQE